MELAEAKLKFIETWGKLGSEWGINRTMAQVHALLLISAEHQSTCRLKNYAHLRPTRHIAAYQSDLRRARSNV